MEGGIINHPGHNHPLRKLDCKNDSLEGNGICSGCNWTFEDDLQNVFSCQEKGCEYYLHGWCAHLGHMDDDYSDQIDHPLHPQHPLTLHFTTSYPPSLSPNNNNNGRQTQTTDDHQYFVCSFCKQTRTSGFLLHCAPCGFYLDFSCAGEFVHKVQFLSQYEFRHFFHKKHSLLPYRFHHPSISLSAGVWGRRHLYSSSCFIFCRICGIDIQEDELVLICSASGCENYYLHMGCFRVPEKMKHPLHPQHTLTLVKRSIVEEEEAAVTSPFSLSHSKSWVRYVTEEGVEVEGPRCTACHNLIKIDAFVLTCIQCPRGSFALDMRCAFLNPTVKYDRHDHHLLAHYKDIDVKDALCAACNTPCLKNLYRCFLCNFNIHKACLSLPIVVDYEDHVHPFTLVNTLNEDQSGTYYCDVCEEKREPNHGLYSCQECPSFVAHFECVLPSSLRKGNQPWMSRKFMQDRRIEYEAETPTLALTSNEKEVVLQLDETIETMGGMVKQLLKERHRTNLKPKMEKLKERCAEVEGMLKQVWELINATN